MILYFHLLQHNFSPALKTSTNSRVLSVLIALFVFKLPARLRNNSFVRDELFPDFSWRDFGSRDFVAVRQQLDHLLDTTSDAPRPLLHDSIIPLVSCSLSPISVPPRLFPYLLCSPIISMPSPVPFCTKDNPKSPYVVDFVEIKNSSPHSLVHRRVHRKL